MNIVETRRAASHAEQAKNSKRFKPCQNIEGHRVLCGCVYYTAVERLWRESYFSRAVTHG